MSSDGGFRGEKNSAGKKCDGGGDGGGERRRKWAKLSGREQPPQDAWIVSRRQWLFSHEVGQWHGWCGPRAWWICGACAANFQCYPTNGVDYDGRRVVEVSTHEGGALKWGAPGTCSWCSTDWHYVDSQNSTRAQFHGAMDVDK